MSADVTDSEVLSDSEARGVWLACRAANDASRGASYREQAGGLLVQARNADPHGEWSVDEDGIGGPDGLPEDWMGIAELDEAAAVRVLQGGAP